MFHIVMLEGLFYEEGPNRILCQKDNGDLEILSDHLDPLLGQQVQFALHHVPTLPIDPTKWGAGCCKFQPAECPVGHHKDPTFLLNVSGSGLLGAQGGSNRPTEWYLKQFDGTRLDLPLAGLVGHTSRIAAVPLIDVEKMRDAVGSEGLDAVGAQARTLQDILNQLQEAMGNGND